MEIATAPPRTTATPWGRVLLCSAVVGPVLALVLLPIGLGLERYVMSGRSMDGGISRGSLLIERVVPVSDLRTGDVITYRAPADADVRGRVTHRIVSIGPDGIVTQGDALADPDPWVLRTDAATMPRVELAVPVVGWAYLLFYGWLGLTLAVVSTIALALLTDRGRRRLAGLGGLAVRRERVEA